MREPLRAGQWFSRAAVPTRLIDARNTYRSRLKDRSCCSYGANFFVSLRFDSLGLPFQRVPQVRKCPEYLVSYSSSTLLVSKPRRNLTLMDTASAAWLPSQAQFVGPRSYYGYIFHGLDS